MNFIVGQRVVCVRESKPSNLFKDNIYTIKVICPIRDSIGNIGVKVLETECTLGNTGYFNSDRFRALKLDYNFVEEIIKQVIPQKQTT